MSVLRALPRDNAVTDRVTGLVSHPWDIWLRRLQQRVETNAQTLQQVALTAQAASIAATAFIAAADMQAAVYRVSFATQITQAATVSSSLQVAYGWTSGGVAQTETFTALTTNTTASHQSGQAVVLADAGTAITYAVTYASSGATAMQYRITVLLEQMP